MDRAYSTALKEMLHVIKFLLDMKNYGLKFTPNLEKNAICYLCFYSDSDLHAIYILAKCFQLYSLCAKCAN